MKKYVGIEINGSHGTLGGTELPIPHEFLLIEETTEAINANRAFYPFMEVVYDLIVNVWSYEFKEKIKNVYVTFLDNQSEFICSAVIDKINKRRGTYTVGIIDWAGSGYTFKYADDCDDLDLHRSDSN